MRGKHEVFKEVEGELQTLGFTIAGFDDCRPWGGFFVIDENEALAFAQYFFPEVHEELISKPGRLSPKILIVAPGTRLSWQYHHRRTELWKLIAGEASIVRSLDDFEGDEQALITGELNVLSQGERHRLVGKESWGIVAEIWNHTDPANPSNEEDIVRLQDDFGRKSPKT